MGNVISYSASLTGEPFLLAEIKEVAKMKLQGLDEKEIRDTIVSEKIFQYTSDKSVVRRIPAVFRRLKVLTEQEIDFLLNKPFNVARIINLYAIAASDRIVKEFMYEIIADKFEISNLYIDRRDVNEFFALKASQDEDVRNWKESTIKKLKSSIINIFCEAGVITDKKSGCITRTLFDLEVTKYFEEKAEWFLIAIGEKKSH